VAPEIIKTFLLAASGLFLFIFFRLKFSHFIILKFTINKEQAPIAMLFYWALLILYLNF
jgi:hypothetical protein